MGLYGAIWFETKEFVDAIDDPNDWANFVVRDKAIREGYHPTAEKVKIEYHPLTAGEIEMYRETGAPIDLKVMPGDYLIRVTVKVREDSEVRT